MEGQVGAGDGPLYGVGPASRIMGISRSTLRYYEDAGLIAPRRKAGSGYRLYSPGEINDVAACAMLRNAGYALSDAREMIREGMGKDDLIEACLDGNALVRARCDAYDESFAMLRTLYADDNLYVPSLCTTERYLLFLSEEALKARADDIAGVDELRGLHGQAAPVFLHGALTEGDFFCHRPLGVSWGSCIPERWLALYPGLEAVGKRAARLGGMPCVRISRTKPIEDFYVYDKSYAIREKVGSFLKERGLRACGEAFFANSTPIFDTLYITAYLPVEATNLRGRLALRQCGA